MRGWRPPVLRFWPHQLTTTCLSCSFVPHSGWVKLQRRLLSIFSIHLRRPLQVVFTTASLSHIIALFFLSRLLAPLTCATQSRGFFVQIPCAAQLAACAAQLAQPAEQPANLPCRSHGISPRRKNGLQIPWISRVLSADPLNFASSFEEYPTLLQRARPSIESTVSQRRSWSSCPESAAECLVQRCRGRFGFDRFRPIRSYFARSSRKVNTLF